MEWNRSETLALASPRCVHCKGLGCLHVQEDGTGHPCGCVLRAIFRKCYDRFRECALCSGTGAWPAPEMGATRDLPGLWGRKNEEFVADFLLVAKRTLAPEEHVIFRYRYLLGADWRLCCRKLKLDRGQYFHTIYRIQRKLGRVFRELEPYSLFPTDEYFGIGLRARTPAQVIPIRAEKQRPPGLPRPHLKRTA